MNGEVKHPWIPWRTGTEAALAARLGQAMTLYLHAIVRLCLVGLSTAGAAAPGPLLDVEKLVADADTIAVARITSVDARRRGASGAVSVQIEPLKLLKGSSGGGQGPVEILFVRRPHGGTRLPEAGATRVVLLRRVGQAFEIADPFYPTLPASLALPAEGGSPLDRVVEAVASVATDTAQSHTLRREAIHALWGVRHPTSLDRLRRVSLGDASLELRAAAAATLLMAGDTDSLLVAEELLGARPIDRSSESHANLLAGLGLGHFADSAVPALSRLLSHPDVEARRRAAFALRTMRSTSAVPALKRALDDPDVEVQYSAVMALAELAPAAAGMAPSVPVFRQHPAKYTAYWKTARVP